LPLLKFQPSYYPFINYQLSFAALLAVILTTGCNFIARTSARTLEYASKYT